MVLACFIGLFTLAPAAAETAYGTVTFAETGLAFGTSWQVTLNGVTCSSTTNSITFSDQPQGTYTYSIDTPAGYALSSRTSGTITVTNTNCTVSATFVPRALGSWTYAGNGGSGGEALVAACDGGYAIASTCSFAGSDFVLTKVSAKGEFQWNKTYSLTSDSNEDVFDIVACSDGGYAITGYSDIPFNSNGQDFFLVRTDANGNLLWSKSYGGAGMDVARRIIATSDGGFAIAGYTDSFGAGGSDAWLVRVDSSGKQLWNKTYGGTGDDCAYGIAVCSNGGFALTGAINGDAWLIRVDSSGKQLWYRTYGGAKNDAMFDIISNSDGGFSMAGDTYSYSPNALPNAWFLRVNSLGEIKYNQTYGSINADCFYGIAPVSTGTYGAYVLVGYTGGAAWVLKIAGDTLVWEKYFDGSGLDVGNDIIACEDGGFAITGSTGTYDILLGSTDYQGGVVEPTTYTLTMLTSGQGSVSPGNGTCVRNATLSLTAIPDNGWIFLSWGGAATGSTVTMDGNKTVTASFMKTLVKPTTNYYITVNSLYGSPSNSGKVAAGNSFTASVNSTESAGEGIRWSCTGYQIDNGELTQGTSYTFENVNANHTITFQWQKECQVTVASSVGGSVSPSYSGSWVSASTLTVSATANSGYNFKSWSTTGDVTVAEKSSAKTNAQVTGPCTITAVFTQMDDSESNNTTTTPTSITATLTSTNTTCNISLTGNITAAQIANMTITPSQSNGTTIVTFVVTGQDGTVGFGNFTVAKSAIPIGVAPVVYIDGVRAESQGYLEDSENYYIWCTTSFSKHTIAFQFLAVQTPTPTPVPISNGGFGELWLFVVLFILVAAVAIAIALWRQKRQGQTD